MTHAACCVSVQAVNFYSCVRAYLLCMKEAVRVVKVSVCVRVCVSLLFSADFRRSCHGSSHQAHTESSASPLTDTLHGMFSFTSFHYVSLCLSTSQHLHPILIFFAYHSLWLSVSIQSSCVTPSLCLRFFNPSVDQVVWPTIIGQCPYSRSGVTESS